MTPTVADRDGTTGERLFVNLVDARQQRLRDALEPAGFDAFLAASPANVDQVTGYRSVAADVFGGHQMAALISPDDVQLVCPVSDSAPAMDAGVPGEALSCFGRFYFESSSGKDIPTGLVDQHDALPDAVASAVKRLRLHGKRIGADVAGFGASWPAIEAALGDDITMVDASGWAGQVRAAKLPGEIERIGRAAAVTEAGISRAIDAARVGMTENELAAIVASTMVEQGGKPKFVVVTSGERSALSDATATQRALQPGDLLRFDVGCVLDGYWSDVGRTAVIGEPDALQQRRYDAIYAGEQAQLDQIRVDMPAREAFDLAVAVVQEHGIVPYRRQHCGHGIGGDVYEPPIISPAFDTPIAAGMTFCLETPFYELGWGGMMVEDTVVVTEDGVEMLTGSDRSLRVVEA